MVNVVEVVLELRADGFMNRPGFPRHLFALK